MKRLGLLLPFAIALASADTIRVPAQHASIQAAIEAANPGDTVLVNTGTYREHLQLKPGLVVRSIGADEPGVLGLQRAEATIIDGEQKEQTGVTMAEGATLDGFTITNVGRYDDAKWQKHHATRGDEQEHEHIGGFGAPGIGADGVSCTISNNIVHHNGDTGIALRGADGRTITPIVKGNFCYRNMGGGIGIMKGASGLVIDNICSQNFYAGIGHSGASPLVSGNTCYENIRAGIGISEGAAPVVRANRCYRNRRAGIGIRTGPNTCPVVEDNECFENGMAGIGTDDHAAPIIRKNRCNKNEMAGIGSRGDAHPLLIGNVCRENKAAGIGFEECTEGRAVVMDNQVVDNALVAVGIHSGWNVTLAGNQLSRVGGLPPIVMIFDGAEASLRGNTISGEGVAGVRVAGTAHLDGNHFAGLKMRPGGPPNFGVWALEGSRVTMRSNQFISWRHALHATKSTIVATDNTSEDFHGSAFVVQASAEPAHLVGNLALTAKPDQQSVKISGPAGVVANNVVQAPKRPGP